MPFLLSWPEQGLVTSANRGEGNEWIQLLRAAMTDISSRLITEVGSFGRKDFLPVNPEAICPVIIWVWS